MEISAVTLTAKPWPRPILGIRQQYQVGMISSPAQLLEARLRAISRVTTPWFFFLDDTDDLPDNYMQVLQACMDAGTPVAYTNELINGELRRSAPYSQEAHFANPMLVHHLVVCRTEAALRAASVIPRGDYAIENLLYFQMAKEGASWIDEVGYHWNRVPTGLSHRPDFCRSLVTSTLWAQSNRH